MYNPGDLNNKSKSELIEIILALGQTADESEEIMERLNLYSRIIEQTSESIAVQDLNGKYIYVNKSYEQLRGYTKEELLNKTLKDNYTEDERAKRESAFEIIMQDGFWRGELNFTRKDGSIVQTLCTTVLLKNPGGDPVAVVGLMTDISDIKKAEEDLLEAKKDAEKANEAKSYFLANMSHEIRTPMNALLGFTGILLDEEKDSKKNETLKIIMESGEILLDLINSILDLSKIEAGKYEVLHSNFSIKNLLVTIKKMFNAIARERGLAYKIIMSKSVPEILYGDRRFIRQIVLNLLGNAFKFTREGEIVLTCKYKHGILSIAVSDTGPGIPEEKLEDIFQPFRQVSESLSANTSGTGLGLAISRELARLMNGEITVSSKLNAGSTFTLSTPMPEAASRHQSSRSIDEEEDDDEKTFFTIDYFEKDKNGKKSYKKSATLSNIKILVAEDNTINQKLFTALLNKLGYTCDIACDGKETIEMVKKGDYDIIFMDIQMPVLDGESALKMIRNDEKTRSLYIIAQTAYAMKGDKAHFLETGFDDYISKPIDKNKLRERIERYISCR